MYMFKEIFYIITILNIIWSVQSSRILGISPYPGKSHNELFDTLMEGLAVRGHQVDVITHFPMKNPPVNYQVAVNLSGTLKSRVNGIPLNYISEIESEGLVVHIAKDIGKKQCDLLKRKKMQVFIKNQPRDPPYDLVILHTLAANCYMGFGHLLKVPVVAISTTIEYPWFEKFIGNDNNLAYTTNWLTKKFDKHNFWDRLHNVLSYHWNVYQFYYHIDEYQTDIMRKYLSPDILSIRDVEKNIALTLINGNPLIHGMKPTVPSLVDISGLHIKPNTSKLTPELQEWLDESTNGVIYFTLGSMVLIESLPVDTIVDIYKSFTKLAPMRVLMKIADKMKLPADLPNNVLTLPWIPQKSVLAHKNTRVFITHGGMFGTQEAMYFGVPMIGIPLCGDQKLNIDAFVNKQMAIEISIENLSSKVLDEALNKIINDSLYRRNAQLYSKLFKDKPMEPLETAIFWIEYVIRNKPFPLVAPALNMPWWQLALLDIYGFILFILLSLVAIAYYTLKLIVNQTYFSCKNKTKKD